MTIPEKYVVSDLLRHRVRCDQGMDHGPGVLAWMHPPVHRILGWVTRPSNLRLSRDVWRLNQIRGIGNSQIYVRGMPTTSDQATVDRLPTLLEADLLNKNGDRLGMVADLVFDLKSGLIFSNL